MWLNEKDFGKLPIIDQITCKQIIKWRRRKTVKSLVRKEKDGSYSVNIADKPCSKKKEGK